VLDIKCNVIIYIYKVFLIKWSIFNHLAFCRKYILLAHIFDILLAVSHHRNKVSSVQDTIRVVLVVTFSDTLRHSFTTQRRIDVAYFVRSQRTFIKSHWSHVYATGLRRIILSEASCGIPRKSTRKKSIWTRREARTVWPNLLRTMEKLW